MPPLQDLAVVLASDVLGAKAVTEVCHALGFSLSYRYTLPWREEAEKEAYASRALAIAAVYLCGRRCALGFDNINVMRKFLGRG